LRYNATKEEEEGDGSVATVAFLRCSVAKQQQEGDDNFAASPSSLRRRLLLFVSSTAEKNSSTRGNVALQRNLTRT